MTQPRVQGTLMDSNARNGKQMHCLSHSLCCSPIKFDTFFSFFQVSKAVFMEFFFCIFVIENSLLSQEFIFHIIHEMLGYI